MSNDMSLPERHDRRTVSVACTLRSGSNLLCEFLEKHGFGRPAEHFQDHVYRNYMNRHLESGVEERSINNVIEDFKNIHDGCDWFGIKWNWYSFHIFHNESKTIYPGGVFDVLPRIKWIRLGRRKRVRQAVSLYIAQNINVWSYIDVPNISKELIYSFHNIDRIVDYINQEENMWDNFFESHDIDPCHIYYEDMVRDPEAELKKVAAYLGCEGEELQLLDFDIRTNYNNISLYSPRHEEFVKLYYADLGEEFRDRPSLADGGGGIDPGAHYGARDEKLGLLENTRGRYPTLEKHQLDRLFHFEGLVERIEQDHFPDGVAFWLEDDGVASAEVECDAVVISLLMHAWSGEVELTFDDETFVFDLYSPIPSLKSFSHEWDTVKFRSVRIKPSGRRNLLSSGSQVWIQRFWSRRCAIRG